MTTKPKPSSIDLGAAQARYMNALRRNAAATTKLAAAQREADAAQAELHAATTSLEQSSKALLGRASL